MRDLYMEIMQGMEELKQDREGRVMIKPERSAKDKVYDRESLRITERYWAAVDALRKSTEEDRIALQLARLGDTNE